MDLVRVKTAIEFGRSLLNRRGQGRVFQVEGRAHAKHNRTATKYWHVCRKMEIWSVRSVRFSRREML